MDDIQTKRLRNNHVVRFIIEDFHIGGHKNTSKATDGNVKKSFIGIIKDVKLNGTAYLTEFDLFREMWKDTFPG